MPARPRFGCPIERARSGDLGVTNCLAQSDIADEAQHAGKLFKQSSNCVKPDRYGWEGPVACAPLSHRQRPTYDDY